MASRVFDFTGASGQELSGRIELPEGPAHAFAVLAHCFSCSKDTLGSIRVARALARLGIGVLRFDFTGLGDSDGEFGRDGLSGDVRDVIAAAATMGEAGMAPALLVGHSFGGAAVLAAAGELPGIKAVATIAAPFDVNHIEGRLGDSAAEIREHGEAEVRLAGRPFRLKRSFLEDIASHDPATRIAALRRPLLVLHSPTDSTVSIDEAGAIFRAAKHPKSFVSLDGADHLLTRQQDAEFAAVMIAAWAERYLPKREAIEMPGEEQRVVAELTGKGKFQTRIAMRGGAIFADEPVEVGGGDTGPTPYELLGAALGACTAMTLKLYADGKGFALPPLSVKVAHARLKGETPPDRFTREILFKEDVPAERRAKLMEIADKCPVHRTLERGAEVVTIDRDRPITDISGEPASQHAADMAQDMSIG